VRSALLALLLVLGAGAAAFAQPARGSGADAFAAGERAFAAEDYAAALAAFREAAATGRDGPAVRYNIGVCLYRLERFEEAAQAFDALERSFPDMQPLAAYNLGLAETKRGRLTQARSAFERAVERGDENIRALALTMLERVDAQQPEPTRWTRVLELGVGHDDNVALIDSASLPAGRSADSVFAELNAYFGKPFAGERLRFDANVYHVAYTDAEEFDQLSLYVGTRARWRVGAWYGSAGPFVNRSTLDGTGFEQEVGASLDVRYALGQTGAALGFLATRGAIDELSDEFAYVDGTRTAVGVFFIRPLTAGSVRLDYREERNDRAGAGVSPDRSRYAVSYRRAFRSGWTGELGYEYRESDYARLDVPRHERRRQFELAAEHRLGSDWIFDASLRADDNSADDGRYTYERTRVAVGLSRAF
jgi:tetratricopeptide (TPR) repeat protein